MFDPDSVSLFSNVLNAPGGPLFWDDCIRGSLLGDHEISVYPDPDPLPMLVSGASEFNEANENFSLLPLGTNMATRQHVVNEIEHNAPRKPVSAKKDEKKSHQPDDPSTPIKLLTFDGKTLMCPFPNCEKR